jgi:hypothetical protein
MVSQYYIHNITQNRINGLVLMYIYNNVLKNQKLMVIAVAYIRGRVGGGFPGSTPPGPKKKLFYY